MHASRNTAAKRGLSFSRTTFSEVTTGRQRQLFATHSVVPPSWRICSCEKKISSEAWSYPVKTVFKCSYCSIVPNRHMLLLPIKFSNTTTTGVSEQQIGHTRSKNIVPLSSTLLTDKLCVFGFNSGREANAQLNRYPHLIRKFASSAASAVKSCWKCGRALDKPNVAIEKAGSAWDPSVLFYCTNAECGVLQPATDNSYFTLFGLEENYDIDEKELTKRFKKMQQRLHPDKSVHLSSVSRPIGCP